MSYETCRAAFDEIIGNNKPTEPWALLQARLYVWQVHNYSTPNPAHLALGVVEEFGELVEAVESDEIDDAIADVAIFAIQLATCYRLDVGQLIADAAAIEDGAIPKRISISNGRLCHVILKSEQKIRGLADRDAARRAVYGALLSTFAICMAWAPIPGEFFALVSSTAERVMARKKADLPMVTR